MSKKKPKGPPAQAAPGDQEPEKPVYEPNPKHKVPWQPGRKGTPCPSELSLRDAANLLAASTEFDGARWAVRDGRAYKAKQHARGRWHGWPVGWVEVPAALRFRWLENKMIRKHDLKRYWNLSHQ